MKMDQSTKLQHRKLAVMIPILASITRMVRYHNLDLIYVRVILVHFFLTLQDSLLLKQKLFNHLNFL